jgi:hypothetical protein
MRIAKYAVIATIVAFLFAGMALSLSMVNAQGSITIVVDSAVGGTTDPGPGTYTYTAGVNGSATLTAIPYDGWEFAYWVYAGYTPGHPNDIQPQDNVPQIYTATIDVTHDYNTFGYTYEYQPVFVPSSGSTPNPPTEISLMSVGIMAAGFSVAIAVVGAAAYVVGKRRAK